MKTLKSLLIILLLVSYNVSYADVIPENSHYVDKCVKITNVENYPDISLIGYVIGVSPTSTIPTYLIASGNCLTNGYKFNTLAVYAVRKSYLIDKDLTAIDWTKDKNAILSNTQIECSGGYIDDAIPISAIEQYYRIAGFTNNSVILYKWKEVNKFNNGRSDSIRTYAYGGDSTELSQKMQTGVTPMHYNSTIDLYPNPAHKTLHIKLNNNYQGAVSLELITLDGKTVKSIHINKSTLPIDYTMNVDNLSRGTYFANIVMGKSVVSKIFNIR